MGSNDWFEFKQFRIEQKKTAMKVGTDGVLLGAWVSLEEASSILDVGTGTGLIALMLAQRSTAHIEAIEIEAAAFQEADYNFKQSPWKERLKIHQEDFHLFSQTIKHRYDLVVSNPPFFIDSLKTSDPQTAIAKHHISLTYEQLIQGSSKLLKPDGRLSLVAPFSHSDLLRETARLNGFYLKRRWDVITKIPKPPTRVLMEFSLTPVYPDYKKIILREESGEFSEDFRKLTSPFYLNF